MTRNQERLIMYLKLDDELNRDDELYTPTQIMEIMEILEKESDEFKSYTY